MPSCIGASGPATARGEGSFLIVLLLLWADSKAYP